MQIFPRPVSHMEKMTGDAADPVFFIKGHISRNSKWRNNRHGMAEVAAVPPGLT